MRFVYINIAGIILGIATGILSLQLINRIHFKDSSLLTPLVSNLREKQVIGFLPYWLLKNADKDYSPYLTTLSYFALRLDSNGSIQKLDNPQEEEPGWSALSSGKLDKLFKSLQKKGINLSLVLASGDNESIGNLLSEPDKKAKKNGK